MFELSVDIITTLMCFAFDCGVGKIYHFVGACNERDRSLNS